MGCEICKPRHAQTSIDRSRPEPAWIQSSDGVRDKPPVSQHDGKTKTDQIDLRPIDAHAFSPTVCQQRQAAIDNTSYHRAIDQWRPASMDQLVHSLQQLSRNQSEIDRAWMIFYWIAKNIRYDTSSFFSNRIPPQSSDNVFTSKAAVCEGYATLYARLCEQLGLQCRKVSGYAKGYGFNPRQTSFEKTDHAWNILTLSNGHSYFIESTWGAGHLDSSTQQYKAQLSSFYFMCRPEHMIYKHLPEDPQWQLLARPLTMQQYLQLPAASETFFEHGLSIVSPAQSNRVVINAGETYGKVVLRSPDDVRLSAAIQNCSTGQRIENGTLVHFNSTSQLWECLLAPNGGNVPYEITIFARRKNEEKSRGAVEFDLQVSGNSAQRHWVPFPRVFGLFHDSKCQLFEPLSGVLARGSAVLFHCRIPGVQKVRLTVDGNWLDENASDLAEDGTFKRMINVGQREVAVWVQFGAAGRSYEGLLTYSVQ